VDEETVKKASTVTTMTVVVVIIVEIALTIITGTPVDLPN